MKKCTIASININQIRFVHRIFYANIECTHYILWFIHLGPRNWMKPLHFHIFRMANGRGRSYCNNFIINNESCCCYCCCCRPTRTPIHARQTTNCIRIILKWLAGDNVRPAQEWKRNPVQILNRYPHLIPFRAVIKYEILFVFARFEFS